MATGKDKRRRGVQLENAILDAAWKDLTERGYTGLTFAGVAERAGTSRPVLYRRWANRTQLAMAAVGRYFSDNPIVVPDLGSVRGELCLLLRRMADRLRPELIELMLDAHRDLADANSTLAEARAELYPRIAGSGTLQPVLDRAIERGEIDPARLTPRIVSLPGALVRHEIFMTYQAPSNKAIEAIVDEIFMPLVRPANRPKA